MQPDLPNKKQVMDALLMQASSVFVHLDPRRSKVVVPPQFRKQPMLVLELGLNMRIPIPDLEVDEEGIGCTLSFGGRPYWCQMPWEAVFALVTSDQRGMVWPPDVPPEVADRFKPPPAAKQPSKDDKKAPNRPGPRLVSVSEEAGASSEAEDHPPAQSPKTEDPKTEHKLEAVGSAIGSTQDKEAKEAKEAKEELPPAPSMEGNAAAVLEPPAAEELADSDKAEDPDDVPKRKLPPYLRVVK